MGGFSSTDWARSGPIYGPPSLMPCGYTGLITPPILLSGIGTFSPWDEHRIHIPMFAVLCPLVIGRVDGCVLSVNSVIVP